MKIKLSLNCPFAEYSIGNGIVIKRESGWMECEETGEIKAAIKEGFLEYEGKLSSESKDKTEKKSDKEVWVFVEINDKRITRVSLELIGKGKELAEKLGTDLGAIILMDKDEYSKELIDYGADKVYVAEDILLKEYHTRSYTQIITEAIKKYSPQIVLYGATHIGRDLAPRIARKIETGLTADCTSLDITDKNELLQTRPAFGGNLMAQILCKNMPQMSTVRPGVMQIPHKEKREGKIIKLESKINPKNINTKIKKVAKSAKKVLNLEEADIIIAGGRGLENKENFEKLVCGLAKKLNAEIGASRAAIDSGWIEKNHQVGQTGKTVRPKVYIALGISGAIQHRAGMQNSDLIIAVNKNPSAEIFKVADYGIVADVNEFVPAFMEELK